jgi:hypothetical protein
MDRAFKLSRFEDVMQEQWHALTEKYQLSNNGHESFSIVHSDIKDSLTHY